MSNEVMRREMKEAIDAGERALSSLGSAQEKLNSAGNWGIFDILGGGLFSTMIKRSKMDDAQRLIEEAPKEYNEMMPEADTMKVPVTEWKVTYEGGFYPKRGRTGEEICVEQTFTWGDKIWHIPAVYLCAKGMVVDFCIEVEPDVVAEFIDKWHLKES